MTSKSPLQISNSNSSNNNSSSKRRLRTRNLNLILKILKPRHKLQNKVTRQLPLRLMPRQIPKLILRPVHRPISRLVNRPIRRLTPRLKQSLKTRLLRRRMTSHRLRLQALRRLEKRRPLKVERWSQKSYKSKNAKPINYRTRMESAALLARNWQMKELVVESWESWPTWLLLQPLSHFFHSELGCDQKMVEIMNRE